MSKPTFSLAISHTPWRAERVESMRRLRESLGVIEGELSGYRVCAPIGKPLLCLSYCEITDRAPNHVWSLQMWQWAATMTGTQGPMGEPPSHHAFLQDDVIPAPNFWPALRAMVEAVPDQVLALEAVHPAIPALAEAGHRWCTTSEGLVGVAYVLPHALLVEFLEWRETRLKPGALEAITEDTLIDCWLLSTGRRAWHPIPTITDHDVSLASTYGNEGHTNRRPRVRWDTCGGWGSELEDQEFWGTCPLSDAPHLGRFYEAGQIPALCVHWVLDFGEGQYARAMRDDGRQVKRKLFYAKRMKDAGKDVPRIMLCTPVRGGISPGYVRTVLQLARMQDTELELPYEFESVQTQSSDVVRRRSQFVRHFLESDCTHLLFLDADVEVSPQAIRGMLATGKDVVCTPYPMRDHLDWGMAAMPGADPAYAEARAYRYAVTGAPSPIPPEKLEDGSLVEVDTMPLGCALISRDCLEKMVDFYRAELTYEDRIGPERWVPTVALFQLRVCEAKLLSEDQSFCERWLEMGGQVWMYLGPGSPATHHGEHAYRGHIETFGLQRR